MAAEGVAGRPLPVVYKRLSTKAKTRLALNLIGVIALCAQFVKYPQVTFWHETIGLVIVGASVAHLWVDCTLARGLVRKVSHGVPSARSIALLVVDALLLLCLGVIVVTGVATTGHLPLPFAPEPRTLWVYVHLFTPVVMMVCLGIHLGLHGRYLGAVVKHLLPFGDRASTVVVRIALAVVMVGGAVAFSTSEFPLLAGVPQKIVQYVSVERAQVLRDVEEPEVGMTIDPAKSAPKTDASATAILLPQALAAIGVQLGTNLLVVALFAGITHVAVALGRRRRSR